MTPIQTMAIGVLAGLAAAGTAQASVVVSYEGEAPGVENTTATFTYSAVETFDSLPTDTYPTSIVQTFPATANASSPTITMDYEGTSNGIQINPADQYGGAGGTGNYIVAFTNTPYTLNLSSTNLAGGINYFGYWLSALDAGNFAKFYGNNDQLLFTFNPQDVLNVVTQKLNSGEYYGNPNTTGYVHGKDGGEPFIFLNFFDTTGTFSKVVFQEVNFGGGYESDNHTVGHYTGMGNGTIIPLVDSIQATVPEPATWATMLIGFGLLGLALRARRRQGHVFA